ncbi:style cell-cycle inhibitor 1 [Anaeramoeba ignava]|uniref:Style cell-cycle inhibitor 1 n=1 Tax=Anaeramoeba ignava TaxID=1746090 RepID=A0A9Q0RA07_ANAIG|nr:style cell-cycle inhibitor 1 [Anaeramoeba ignava]
MESKDINKHHRNENKHRHKHKNEKQKKHKHSKSKSKSKSKNKDKNEHKHKKHKHSKSKSKSKSKSNSNLNLNLKLLNQIPENFVPISKENYFNKHDEFAMWLKQEKNIFFDDESSKKTHKLFEEFVEEWNSRKLDPIYYSQIDPLILRGQRTSHKWNIKEDPKLKSGEFDNIVEQVKYQSNLTWDEITGKKPNTKRNDEFNRKNRFEETNKKFESNTQSNQKNLSESDRIFAEEEQRIQQSYLNRMNRKKYTEQKKVELEELVPKKTGIERTRELKKIKSEYTRKREDSPEFDDNFIFGQDNFNSMLQKRKVQEVERKKQKEEDLAAKVLEYQQQEKEKVNSLLESLGLKPDHFK